MMSKRSYIVWPALAVCVSVIGCDQPAAPASGPSYAELVVTYNAELEALDRLEAKREKFIKEYAAATAPSESGDTLSKLEGLLKSTKDLKDGTNTDTITDPNEILDNLAERSGAAEEIAGQLLDGLLGGASDAAQPPPTPEAIAAAAERKAAFETELANLDAEVAKQKERVTRARQARDAAEAKDSGS